MSDTQHVYPLGFPQCKTQFHLQIPFPFQLACITEGSGAHSIPSLIPSAECATALADNNTMDIAHTTVCDCAAAAYRTTGNLLVWVLIILLY